MLTTIAKGVTALSGTPTLVSEKVTKKDLANYDPQNWVVFEKASDGSVKAPRLYPAQATRDKVRVNYSKKNKAKFEMTRAVRVSTYKKRITKSK